jgi:hypothetical protein
MAQQILTPGFLYWDGFKYILTSGTFTPAGDLSGDAISQTVVGIQGNPIPGPAGTNTVLTWTGSALIWGSGGSGISTIENQGTPIAGGPFETLNFTGSGVVASNAGDGVATITIAGGGSNVTWADDLVNSTSTNQYVSSLSYSSSAVGGIISINGTGSSLSFANNNTGPLITQASIAGNGTTFTITAQPSTSTNDAGGNLFLQGGANTFDNYTGSSLLLGGGNRNVAASATITVGVNADGGQGSFSITGPSGTRLLINEIAIQPEIPITFDLGVSATINQSTTSSGSGGTLTIQAQDALGASHNGGNLVLSSGTSGSATKGSVELQYGTTTGLTLNPTGVVTIANLGGSGDGYVAVDNSGNLSWSAGTGGGGGGGGNITLGPYASRPPPGTAGALYYPIDGAINFIDNGTAWLPIIDGTLGVQPPLASTFTQSHFTTGTAVSNVNGTVLLANVNGTAADQFQSLLVSGVNFTTSYTLTVAFRVLIIMVTSGEFSNVGICITDGTKFEAIRIGYLDTIQVVQYNTFNSFNQNLTPSTCTMPFPGGASHMWMRIQNVSSGNRTWSASVDGINWYILITEAAGTFMHETDIGFFINPEAGNTQTTQGILESWSLTFP